MARRVLLEHVHLLGLKYQRACRNGNPIDGDRLGLIVGHALDQQGVHWSDAPQSRHINISRLVIGDDVDGELLATACSRE